MAFARLLLVTVVTVQVTVSTALNEPAEDRGERQVTIPTAVSPSCSSTLSNFNYPSTCPTYTIGQSFSSFLGSACQKFCQSECVDPFLKYMESCGLDTTALKLYCGSAPNGQPCCSLLTSSGGLISAATFFTTCNSVGCSLGTSSSCSQTYNSYGCCLQNLNAALGTNYNSWSSCGLSDPGKCLYEPWPLPITKEVLIAITAGGGGGLILLCLVVCCCCCLCCCLCGTTRRRKVVVTSTTMKPFV